MHQHSLIIGFVTAAACVAACSPSDSHDDHPGTNAHPIQLVRPKNEPLSAMATLGREMFFDSTLSHSGHVSCATCHDPSRAYASRSVSDVHASTTGIAVVRAIPSLRYVDRTPPFHVGPDSGETDEVSTSERKPAAPRGGFFWDGRASTLQTQAVFPLMNSAEMGNLSTTALAAQVRARYAARLEQMLGAAAVAPDDRLLAEATFAIARFEIEDSTFHPYDSKYDAYLEGTASLTADEARGLALFENPQKGNCSACHVSRPDPSRQPPTFTDYEYEALGVPSSSAVTDLGLCGPVRKDLATQRQYCGMFRTPSLRNVATRDRFFHNGEFHTLEKVLRFYVDRDTHPELVYPHAANGNFRRFGSLPASSRGNIDTVDAPFNRHAGDAPVLTDAEVHDVIAFLKTLTDGYRISK